MKVSFSDAKGFVSAAHFVQDHAGSHSLLPKAPSSLEGFRRPGHALAGQQRGEDPALVEVAVAQPFHMESSPVRVTPRGRFGATDSEMAWPICRRSNPRNFAGGTGGTDNAEHALVPTRFPVTTASDSRQNTS